MNRFRTRRKAKDQQQAAPNAGHNLPLGLSFSSKSFSKNRKPSPEQKPTVDISAALPASNDFRTSLLMPNLSARFSMLREQDDPSTKIGKANDDSVLFPKRASRLNLFTHIALADITEVASICESIRPPFASRGRTHSYDVDGYDSDGGGSIMNRARPGEGNNLFGGRQKLYKISSQPLSKSQSELDSSHHNPVAMDGKPMYEDDVSLSLFQKHRQKERDNQPSPASRESLDETENSSLCSPTASFSKSRETTSSTASGPRRDSTAATSIDSQPLSPQQQQQHHPHNGGNPLGLASPKSAAASKSGVDHNATIYRKFYDQTGSPSSTLHPVAKDGFDMSGRPSTAATDKRQRADTPPKTSSTLRDNRSGMQSSPSAMHFRTASPPPSEPSCGTPNLGASMADGKPSGTSRNNLYGFVRPLSPPVSDGEDATAFANSVQPEDRGKATAMGLFNKPHQNYDEEQFSSRQVQMHQGRDSPAPPHTPTTRHSESSSSHDKTPPRVAGDYTGEESRPNTKPSSRAASPITHQNSTSDDPQVQGPVSEHMSGATETGQDDANSNTFLDDSTQRSPSSDTEPVVANPLNTISRATSPAFRSTVEDFRFPPPDDDANKAQIGGGRRPDSSQSDVQGRHSHNGSEVETPPAGLGLSGLIRAHLRVDSDKSSLYPFASPHASFLGAKEISNIRSSTGSQRGIEAPKQSQESEAQALMAPNARPILATTNTSNNHPKKESQHEETPPRKDGDLAKFNVALENPPSWQDELQARHHRDGSTETQQERAAFNQELAERRRRVQETLKNVAEASSRSGSPAPSTRSNTGRPASGFSAMLRGKSRGTKPNSPPAVSPPHTTALEQPGKAMKLLWLGNNSSSASSPPPRGSQDDLWKEEEEKMLQAFGRRPKPKQTAGSSPTSPFPRPRPGPLSKRGGQNDDSDRSRQRTATPTSALDSPRDRSTSGDRSKSRHADCRDDLEKVSSNARIQALPNASTVSIAESSSNGSREQPERSASAMSGRYRSDSRANNSSSFLESKLPAPPQATGLPVSSSSGYSPNTAQPMPESSPSKSGLSSSAPSITDGRTTPSFRGRKRSVTKKMISDPTFVSTTHTVSTVDLPPGASLRNGGRADGHGKDPAPPAIPIMNPLRRGRRGTGASTIQTLLPNFTSRPHEVTAEADTAPHSAGPSTSSARPGTGSFSPDKGDAQDIRPAPLKPKPRLRKISSEGGDMNNKARYQNLMTRPSPVLPTFPVVKRGPLPATQHVEGGMF